MLILDQKLFNKIILILNYRRTNKNCELNNAINHQIKIIHSVNLLQMDCQRNV